MATATHERNGTHGSWFGGTRRPRAAVVALLAVVIGAAVLRLGSAGGARAWHGVSDAVAAVPSAPWVGAALTVCVLLTVALAILRRRIEATTGPLPWVHAQEIPHDPAQPHAHALTSLVLFRASTVVKIYAPGFLPRALYALAFQAPFPYEANLQALEAAVVRRNLAGLLTEYWYGERRVAHALGVERIEGRYGLTSEFVAGREPTDHAGARRFLFDLSRRFDAAGLPTWQVDPRQPRSFGNVLERTDGAFVVIDLESGLVSPLASPRAWWRAFCRGHVPIFDDVAFDLTRAYVDREAPAMRAARGDRWLAELRATLDRAESAAGAWHDGEPRIWGRLARGVCTGFGIRTWPRRLRTRLDASRAHADAWLAAAIDAWQAEGRLSDDEALALRAEAREPQFQAVLPHLGVHLVIGVALRFPIGSIARFAYTFGQQLASTVRLVTRRIDRRRWRRDLEVHSPLVLVLAVVPGFGAFAYLASRPIRTHHRLSRIALDATLRRLPRDLYARSGLAEIVPRSRAADSNSAFSVAMAGATTRVVVALLAATAVALFALDVAVQSIDYLVQPDVLGWHEVVRLFDLDSEESLGTWFAVVALAACAALLGLIARAKFGAGDRFRRHWLALAVIVLGLSIDEQAKLHDPGIGAQVREHVELPGPLYYGWVLAAFLSLAIVGAVYRRFVVALPALERTLFAFAGLVYLTGEVGIEMISGWYVDRHGRRDTLAYATVTSVEELLGMLGIVAALAALLTALVRLGDREPIALGRLDAGATITQVPEGARDGRASRPFPLNLLLLSEHVAAGLRLAGHAWGAAATVVFLAVALRGGIPRSPDEAGWEVLAQVAILGVVAVGGLFAWRWRGLGASLLTIGAVGLGVLAAIEHRPAYALLVALAFYLPGLFFWLDWQRTRSLTAVALLAGAMAVLLAGGGYAAARVYDRYYGPVQPVSATAPLPPSLLEWVWSGAATSDSITVKAILAAGGGSARLLVESESAPGDVVASAPADVATGGIAAFTVVGLEPGTRYVYAVEVDGSVDTVRRGRFRTLPAGSAGFTFAFGSCAATGSNGAVFDAIRALDPLFFLVDGDFFYADIDDNDPARFRSAFDETLTSPAQAALYRSLPVAYVWDDHDFGANDADGSSPSRPAAQATYRALVPHYPLPAGPGDRPIYQAFTVGRVRFLLTDVRSARSPESAPDDGHKTMLGAEQKAWLKRELLVAGRSAALVVWVNPVPWIVPAGEGADGWGSYATERRELADFVAANGIRNLIMLGGDAHMLAIDDGTNSDYATNGGAGFPVMHAGALDRVGRTKGGPYSEGAYPGGGQFGVVTVVDGGGPVVEVVWSGRDDEGEEVVGYRFTVPAAGRSP